MTTNQNYKVTVIAFWVVVVFVLVMILINQ